MEIMGRLREIALLVRGIAEEVSIDIRKHSYASVFPNGWCQDTSRVLGKLLQNLGEEGFKLIFGKRSAVVDIATGRCAEPTHMWLERDGIIVDITADQFSGEISNPVLVTNDHSWHDTWPEQQEYDLDELSGNLECTLYEAIISHPKWPSAINRYQNSSAAGIYVYVE